MAASGLDHLKNDYRTRFCRPSRAADIHRKQGQNMLEILQDCFEEKSLITDLTTDSIASLVYSTPKVKDCCIQSPSKECQSSPKSVPVSSRVKASSLQGPAPDEATTRSVQVSEVHQKILANDVGSKSTPKGTPNWKKRSSDRPGSCIEADGECSLSVAALDAKTSESQSAIPSDAQERETCGSMNSENIQSSSTEISFKSKKRLDFEDRNVLDKRGYKISEVKEKMSEGQGTSSNTPQRRRQGLEYEIQPQTKKSFSTLFLETVERKSQLSPVVRHEAVAPPFSSPPSAENVIEDEFIIDESERSFVSQPWVTIPRKGRHLKNHVAPPAESSTVLQDTKSREKHHTVSPMTLTGNSDVHQAQPVVRSRPSVKKQGTSCALTDELENNSRSTECEMYSENTKSSSGDKRTVKRKPRTLTANVVEQLNIGQHKDRDKSSVAQDKLQRSSGRSMNDYEEMESDPVFQKEVLPVGKKRKSSTNKDKEASREKHLLSGSGDRFVPKDVTLTINRSCRISRRPSDWWVVKPEESLSNSNSSIRNELPVCHKNTQESQKPTKPTKKRNRLSKNVGGRTRQSKRQKAATPRSSRVPKSVKVKRSTSTVGHNEHSSSQCEPLDSDEANLAQKESLCCPGAVGQCKDQDSLVSAQNVNLKSQTSECASKIPTELNSNSGESKISILEASGPSRLKNYVISEKSDSGMEEEEVQEDLGNSGIKQYAVSPNKKIHPKIVFPTNTPNVRRTKRIRLKPLEYWRGERVDYQERLSGGFVIHGVLSPTPVSCKRKAKGNTGKVNKKVNAKRVCSDNHERRDRLVVNLDIPLGDPLQPTRVKDPETSTFISMDLIRPRDTYKFFIELDELKVYKTLDTPFFSTGKLVLGPREEKGKQYVGPDILIFYVTFGDLLCTIHETPYVITTGDSFYVPSGNYYNIRNLRNEESILLFTQIKR